MVARRPETKENTLKQGETAASWGFHVSDRGPARRWKETMKPRQKHVEVGEREGGIGDVESYREAAVGKGMHVVTIRAPSSSPDHERGLPRERGN